MRKKTSNPIEESSENSTDLSSEIKRLKKQLKIEAALEKIRNRTLLMRDSSELNEAVAVFFQQFQSLDLLPKEARTYFCDIDTDTDIAKVWMTHADGTVMKGSHKTPLTQSASMSQYYKAWKQKKPIMVRNYSGAALSEYLKFVSSLPHVKVDKDYQKLFRSPPKQVVMTDANFLQGNIGIMTFEPLTQEAIDTLTRFAKVFEFTYTRFLDLQKAEAQAREAQIEAALERVRAKALAMHISTDLINVANELREQTVLLGQSDLAGSVIELYEVDPDCIESWYAFRTDGDLDGALRTGILRFAKDSCLVIKEMLSMYRSSENEYTLKAEGRKLKEFYAVMQENLPEVEKVTMPSKEYYHCTDFTGGTLLTSSLLPPSVEAKDLQRRVASVFDLAYRRFLDLQKAEAQAREAQIEAALERVRSRTMGMHKSQELKEVIQIVYEQFVHLNIHIEHTGFIVDYQARDDMDIW